LIDHPLIDQALQLCEMALVFFEGRGDPVAQDFMDRFAISLAATIAEYLLGDAER
jgi:hypothetical protein